MSSHDSSRDFRGGIARRMQEAREGSEHAKRRVLEMCRRYLEVIAQQELAPELRERTFCARVIPNALAEVGQAFETFDGRSRRELLAWLRRCLLKHVGGVACSCAEVGCRSPGGDLPRGCGPMQSDFAGVPADADPPPARLALDRDEHLQLKRAVAALDGDLAHVIRSHHRDGLSFADIARRIGCSTEEVVGLWLRAVMVLQENLERDDGIT